MVRLKDKQVKYSIIGILSVIFLVLFFGFGIYYYQWRSNFIFGLSKVVPYPAILVDWEFVPYSTYVDDLNTLLKYWEFQRKNSNVLLGIPSNKEIRERLVDKLIQEKVIQIWARQNDILVTNDEVAIEWGHLKTQSTGPEEVDLFLDNAYGWSDAQFKERVLVPFLLQQKVQIALEQKNKSNDVDLMTRAQEVYLLTQVNGIDFSDIAKENSEDEISGPNGGDLGYFARGTFEPDFEKQIFSMKIGEISEPVKSSYGYHIIKLEDFLYDEDDYAIQARIKHILIKSFDFEEWLDAQKQELSIYRLVI
jgi:hypothetical protein